MRLIWRLFGGAALLAIIAGLSGYLLRAPLAEAGLRWALARAGVENPALKVDAISLAQIRIVDLTAGANRAAPALDIKEIRVAFSLPRLLRERAVSSLAVGPGRVVVTLDDKGRLLVAGAAFGGEEKGEGKERGAPAAPFDRLEIKDIDFAVSAPQGEMQGRADGAFSMAGGGAFTIEARTASMTAAGWRAENAVLEASIELGENGAAAAKARLAGDLAAPAGEARGARLAIDAGGASWRDALRGGLDKAAGEAHVNLQIADIPASSNPLLEKFASLADKNAAPIERFSAEGAFIASLQGDALMVSAGAGAPLRFIADRGDVFLVNALDGAPLYERAGPSRRIALSASMQGEALQGEARLEARSQSAGAWDFKASGALGEETLAGVSLGETQFSLAGDLAGAIAAARLDLATTIHEAAIDRLRVLNAPVAAALRIDADFGARRLSASTGNGACLVIDSAGFRIDGQDMDARLERARLCGGEAPLMSFSWADAPHADIVGTATAKYARYRYAGTLIEGAPPRIAFEAAYDRAQRATTMKGEIADGRVVLNDALTASNADGAFSLRADEGGFSGEARLAAVRIAQNADPVQVAPIVAAGKAALADDRFDFDFTAATPSGLRLGAGAVKHDLGSGRGGAEFHSGELAFAPRGLQPAALIPALKGVVGETNGGASGYVHLKWGPKPSDFKSYGDIALRDVSFRGPGRAVSKTAGLTGELRLASLAPLRSDGPQTLSVELIDLDALKLENGAAHFELPGDETLHIIDAEFPWFGGRIGAYEAVSGITGGKATMALRAENVDLGEMLAYLKVDGLSGEGVVRGVLPVVFEGGKARIENGELSAIGPGVVRYRGKAVEAAAQSNEQAALAFDLLRDLHFTKLTAVVNGALDGDLTFEILFEGTNDVPVNEQRVPSPVIYRINIEAPLLALIEQARVSTDFKLQFQRLKAEKEGAKAQ